MRCSESFAGRSPTLERDLELSQAIPVAPRVPDARGRFGTFGGRYVPEVLIPALDELSAAWSRLRADPSFTGELNGLLRDFVGRPTPLTHASRLSSELGYEIWLKREDLAHTGAHKINNAIGQALLAKRLGAKRIIAETGAGQHGDREQHDDHQQDGEYHEDQGRE